MVDLYAFAQFCGAVSRIKCGKCKEKRLWCASKAAFFRLLFEAVDQKICICICRCRNAGRYPRLYKGVIHINGDVRKSFFFDRLAILALDVKDKEEKRGGKRYYEEDTLQAIACDPIVEYMSAEQLKKSIERTRRMMQEAAEKMEFIEAAQYRDEMFKLQELLKTKE